MSLWKSLAYHRKAHLAVVLAAAVASTVLTGALLAGDSVRGSLRALTLARLGGVDLALVSESFFREALAAELAADPALAGVAPAIVARGAASHGERQARASGVTLYGVDDHFAELFGTEPFAFERAEGQIFPSVVVSESLARELEARAGDEILLSFELPSLIPRETLVGEKDAGNMVASRRFTVTAVLPDHGLGGFSLQPHQSSSFNAFVPLAGMQRDLEREGRVNALVASRKGGAGAEDLEQAIRRKATLDDLGLRLRRAPDGVVLESREFFLKSAVIAEAETLAQELGASSRRVLSYIVTKIEARDRTVPYSTVAALAPAAGGDPGLRLPDGTPEPALADGEILLGRWAADDLGARPGDPVRLTYQVVGPAGELLDRDVTLRLRGAAEMDGLAVDRTLTPRFPGIDGADNISDWNPPFPVDLGVIRPRDEEYWDLHGPTPKAFIAEETGRRLWRTRFGDVTSIRLAVPAGQDPIRLEQGLARGLMARVDLAPFGLLFRPVKQEGLAAAAGSTDFSGLFVAFSFFLIVSAVLLVGLLFSLGVERRAGELGLLLAVGFPVRAVRRRLLAEGAVLAGVGALLGLAGALGYAALLMAGLRTWWRGAVGTPHLHLHAEPSSLITGAVASVLVVLLAIAWTVRRLSRVPAPALLVGSTASPEAGARRRRPQARLLAIGATIAFLGFLAYALIAGQASSPGVAFGIGASLLTAGLAFFSLGVRRPTSSGKIGIRGGLLVLAARNGAANPGQSLLSVALVACACFVLVTVAANRRTGEAAGDGPPAGAGGFPLFAEADVPLIVDLNRTSDQEELGLDTAALRGSRFVGFRGLPGEDASCLNLYRPGRPRLLGVPAGFSQVSRFVLRKTLTPAEDPWTLLDQDLGPDVIPAFADESSATWILKLGLGDDLELRDESGRQVRLRLVGVLERGLFQGELLISEASLLRHFPSRTGRSFFLIDAPAARAAEVSQALENGLGRFGFDVSATADRLAAYAEVENTYLSTFQALGGFGLLLGTVGLGLVLLRGVIERRGELATLRAFGFRRSRLAWIVTIENGLLLFLGVGLGTVSGLLASAPHLLSQGGGPPWGSLLGTLLAVLSVGLFSCLAAVWSALRVPLLPVLKAER